MVSKIIFQQVNKKGGFQWDSGLKMHIGLNGGIISIIPTCSKL